MNVIGLLGAITASATIAIGAFAAFTQTLDNTRIRAAATGIHEISLVYRNLHCDLPVGSTRTSAQILSDTDVFPVTVPDPAFGWFAWSYLAGDNGTGSLVITSTEASVATTVQVLLGGAITGINQLTVDLPRSRSLHLPHFAGATDERWDYANVPTPATRCF